MTTGYSPVQADLFVPCYLFLGATRTATLILAGISRHWCLCCAEVEWEDRERREEVRFVISLEIEGPLLRNNHAADDNVGVAMTF